MKTLSPLALEFMKDQVALIVEPSQTFAASIQSCLNELKLPLKQILISRKFEEAKRTINEIKPKLVITEYEVEKQLGLALLEAQSEHYEESARISIIVTKNASDSAIAEAAEEQVDAYVIKPFSADVFRQKIIRVFESKVNPSDYAQKIREGKRHIDNREWDNALEAFVQSKPLTERPTLACFYAGHIYQEKGEVEAALNEFRQGRSFQPLHYKCLIGEFESLIAKKDYTDAYKLVDLIRGNYPITSHRLGQIFIAAVFTQHFDDLPNFYQLFQRIEQRPVQLVQLTSLALLTAGRFFVGKKDIAKACEYFEMGLYACSKKLSYMDKIITELLQASALKEAEKFLSLAHPADVGTPGFNQISFKIDRYILPEAELLEKGRKLVAANEGSPEIYQILVEMSARAGKASLAESIIASALLKNPGLRASLYETLEKNLTPSRS